MTYTRGTVISGHRATEPQSHRVTEPQSHRATESQSHRTAEPQSRRAAEPQSRRAGSANWQNHKHEAHSLILVLKHFGHNINTLHTWSGGVYSSSAGRGSRSGSGRRGNARTSFMNRNMDGGRALEPGAAVSGGGWNAPTVTTCPGTGANKTGTSQAGTADMLHHGSKSTVALNVSTTAPSARMSSPTRGSATPVGPDADARHAWRLPVGNPRSVHGTPNHSRVSLAADHEGWTDTRAALCTTT